MPSRWPSSLRDGRYAVVGLIAEGSQGQTLEAVDKLEGRSVAVKRFQVKGARSWKDVELAEREATVLRRLSHRCLPAYFDHFEEDGALYLVMEKIEGASLAALREERGALSRDEVVAFLHDAADVLGYLHGLDPPVIHRDIKPGNVIRRPDGSFVLVDFGSVRARLGAKGGSTVVGTFGYMAPEQLQGRALPATDVYGVGATALSLLTGVEPEDLPHEGLAIDVERALGDLPDPALVAAIGPMIAPDPSQRAPSLRPLLTALPRPVESHAADRAEPERPGPGSVSGGEEPRSRGGEQRTEGARLVEPSSGVGWTVPAIAGFAMVVMLTLARVGVALATRVAVPLVFVMLSIFFGRSMIRAARDVRQAGRRAGHRLKRWQGAVRPTHAEAAPPPRRGASATPPVRSEGRRAERGPGRGPRRGPGSRVRFEAPSVSGPNAPRATGWRRGRTREQDTSPRGRGGRSAEPHSVAADDTRSASSGGRFDASEATASSGPSSSEAASSVREVIDEIEDAVSEIDREVRRRSR